MRVLVTLMTSKNECYADASLATYLLSQIHRAYAELKFPDLCVARLLFLSCEPNTHTLQHALQSIRRHYALLPACMRVSSEGQAPRPFSDPKLQRTSLTEMGLVWHAQQMRSWELRVFQGRLHIQWHIVQHDADPSQ
jgi:hypothetical protein